MNLIKEDSKKTYIDANGKERHYSNYFLVDGPIRVAIKPAFEKNLARDYMMLNQLAYYKKKLRDE